MKWLNVCRVADSGPCMHFGHPDVANKFPPPKQDVVEHLQRRPGETFAEMRERLAKQ